MALTIGTRELSNGIVVVYAVHDHIAPSPQEWREYVGAARGAIGRAGAERTVGLAVTDGGAPDAEQRQQLVAMLQAETGTQVERIRSAVVSESLVVRAVVGAFARFMKDISLFAPSSTRRALEFIGVPRDDLGHVRGDLETLSARAPAACAVRAVIEALSTEDGDG